MQNSSLGLWANEVTLSPELNEALLTVLQYDIFSNSGTFIGVYLFEPGSVGSGIRLFSMRIFEGIIVFHVRLALRNHTIYDILHSINGLLFHTFFKNHEEKIRNSTH